MADLVVAGAGMAGLAAAAEARRLGAEPLVLEKLARPGGSMRLSSGVIWRHRDFERFREECPDGDERLQRLLFERLDDDLAWLESLDAPVLARETGNPLTTGTRFDPAGLTDALVEAAGGVRFGEPLLERASDVPLILATGGFGASRELLARTRDAARRITPSCARPRAAPATAFASASRRALPPALASTQVYARAMPAPPARIDEDDLVRLSQLYARHADVTNERGERYETATWSEIDVAQWQLRQPRARAWFSGSRRAARASACANAAWPR